jgi:hypothetical protein
VTIGLGLEGPEGVAVVIQFLSVRAVLDVNLNKRLPYTASGMHIPCSKLMPIIQKTPCSHDLFTYLGVTYLR